MENLKPESKKFYLSGFIQRRLDYFFGSNLQEYVNKSDVLAAFSTDHSPFSSFL